MNRHTAIATLRASAGSEAERLDLLIIGGGSIGLGTALDASLRGYRVGLVERRDFGAGTSSRSTKLIHGGLRYLKQGNVALVRESLRERELLLRNAPSLVEPLGFVIPGYSRATDLYYRVGLKAYDLLAGSRTLEKARGLDAAEVSGCLPYLRCEGLTGGNLYHDAQFDDARLALTLARAATAEGSAVANYLSAVEFRREGDRIVGIEARDEEGGETFPVEARAVLLATGPWTDELRALDDPDARGMIVPSQGTHLVFDRADLPAEHALMIPRTEDGRILFVIPFGESVIAGTTDVALDAVPDEPVATPDEIDFILRTLNGYLREPLGREHVRSVFAGVRPLVRAGGGSDTSRLARNHVVRVSERSGLVVVAGGKWTTYRQIAEDAVDAAVRSGGLGESPCRTHDHSLEPHIPATPNPEGERLHPALPLGEADIEEMARRQMARRAEDVLARRTRALVHDASACSEVAPPVAAALARALGRDDSWAAREAESMRALAVEATVPVAKC